MPRYRGKPRSERIGKKVIQRLLRTQPLALGAAFRGITPTLGLKYAAWLGSQKPLKKVARTRAHPRRDQHAAALKAWVTRRGG